ncbi:glutathione S-transferase C-terminal domain-containing protein [Klebsiella quasipneumoniae subsp. similipneumoniae]|uniref:glutathione S-transferase C-terminal domain-containing protein n=1 Tax=Klebsiella quasipneumoniae TaxID=1463165 RepID=UPI0010334C73|nr:glutathione S-transferase C-terminal domain-containing protein [Klebsiella quasipneumoniae]
MAVLENGIWYANKSLDALTHEDTFTNEILPEAGRYHLYVSGACPFAHRPWLVIKSLGLDDAISVSSVAAVRDDNGWAFSSESPDPVNHEAWLRSLYVRTASDFTGRVSVPVLWDRQEEKIVCNDSAKLAAALATDWKSLARNATELLPASFASEIGEMNIWLHTNINRRVYQVGFAASQEDYDREIAALFDALETLDKRLTTTLYLFGDELSLSDLFLFPSLVRFETVYAVHFRANIRPLQSFEALYRYMLNLLTRQNFRQTLDMHHIHQHYYLSHRNINPAGIIPAGPRPVWMKNLGLIT